MKSDENWWNLMKTDEIWWNLMKTQDFIRFHQISSVFIRFHQFLGFCFFLICIFFWIFNPKKHFYENLQPFFKGIPNHFWELIPFSIISNLFSKVSFMFLKCLAQIDHERNLANILFQAIQFFQRRSQDIQFFEFWKKQNGHKCSSQFLFSRMPILFSKVASWIWLMY